MSHALEDRQITQMVIPVSKETYFNTKWVPQKAPLGAYDMLYHPPDYNPKAARSDRQVQKILRDNIWKQESHKGIPSTTHFHLGRPKWKPIDLPTKEFTRSQGKLEIKTIKDLGV
ncbi:hypothetical protein ACJJTC_001536 [Scirpophaga incertulas]